MFKQQCRRGWTVLGLALVGLLLWALVARPAPAGAHALLVRSIPEANADLNQPPAMIELWFSEPLEAGFSQTRLLNSAGDELSTGATIIDPADPNQMTLALAPLEPGIYTVSWQTLSQADGHQYIGSFPFTVLNPDGSRPVVTAVRAKEPEQEALPTPMAVIARWLVLLGGILFLGVPLFRMVVGPAEEKPDSEQSSSIVILCRNLVLQLVWGAGLAILVGSWMQILTQAFQMGGPERLLNLLLETRTGALGLARQILVLIGLDLARALPQPWPLRGRERRLSYGLIAGQIVLMMFLALTARYGQLLVAGCTLGIAALAVTLAYWPVRNDGAAERRIWRVLLTLAGAILFSISISSHASAGAGIVWAVLGDYIHVVAAAAWLGGLVLLAGLIWQVSQTAPANFLQQLSPLIRRFSYLASFAVFILIITGLFRSLVELPSLNALWQTAYGQVLLLKLFLMLLTLGVAFLNNRLVHAHRRASRPALLLPKEVIPQQFNRQVTVETILALALMLSVAVLVQTPTPRSLNATANSAGLNLPFNALTKVDDLNVHVQVTPNQVGVNRFWVHLYHGDGSPIGETQLVRLLFDYRQAQLGQAKAELSPLGQDIFVLEGTYLNQAGQWELSVYIRRRGLDDALAKVSLEVAPPTEVVTTLNPWQNPISSVPVGLLIAVVLVVLGISPFIWGQPLWEKQPRRYKSLRLVGGILVAGGLVLGAGSVPALLAQLNHSIVPVAIHSSTPVTGAKLDALVAGAKLYHTHCLACHGVEGKGDGPLAAGLNPAPANMSIHVPYHDDLQLYGFISQGLTGTAMPAFAGQLTQAEIWHLVNYLRATY